MKIRAQAVTALIEAHQDEFDKILGDMREEAGLSRTAGGMSPEAKQARIDKHLAALRKLGIEVDLENNK